VGAELEFGNVFAALPAPHVIVDSELAVVAANNAFLQVTMLSREEALGRSVLTLFQDGADDSHGSTVDDLAASLERVQLNPKTDTAVVEGLRLRSAERLGGGNGLRHWNVSSSPVLDEGGRLTCIVQQLQEVINLFELRQANDSLVEAAKSRDDFLSRMSHDLRTPLNAVLGFAKVMEREDLNDDQQESLGYVLEGGKALLEMINGILDISRMTSKRLSLSLERVLISGVVSEAVALTSSSAAASGVELSLPDDSGLYVFADRKRLKQILVSLLDNAFKYNKEGGRVVIAYSRVEPDLLGISVSDTGVGVEPEQLDLLFEPFAHPATRAVVAKGLGLGLALSKGLAEAMEGSLQVSSTPGVGSVFTIYLPVSQPVPIQNLP
jgi:signal transduction histidine kinase